MARRREVIGPASIEGHVDVPAELLDNDSAAWSDAAMFRQWVKANLWADVLARDAAAIEALCNPSPWNAEICDRIRYARANWAEVNGIEPDRLESLGIMPIKSLERARLRARSRTTRP